MKWSFATVGIIVLGLTGIAVILLFQSLTTNNENDYYLLKEVTEAAMIDAIDIPYYRETGQLKMIREKFVENFTRRYAESTIFTSSEYNIKFYEIMETPPKASIIIDTGIGTYTIAGNSDEYNIKNQLDAILEYTGAKTYENFGNHYSDDYSETEVYYSNVYTTKELTKTYYAMVYSSSYDFDFNHSLRLPSELVAPNIRDIKIKEKPVFAGEVMSQTEFNEALINRELSFYNFNDGLLLTDNETTKTDYMQSISDYETKIKNTSFDFYNCGLSTDKYSCNETNKYFVSGEIETKKKEKNNAIIKYKVTWSYKEYEFKIED